MFDHVVFGVRDYEASKAFYLRALQPLGIEVVLEGPLGIEMSADGKTSLCLAPTDEKPAHLHIAFRAERREQVDDFHCAALAAGGKDNGGPGLRPKYHPNYYAAFVIDPDGHNIEVVCHEPGG
ncbi:VOC family protein [Aquabacterium humicola]|uniref:VOC family protein n=1 Tax=Aquabacterium humicola TaxID=3237377 RepID=UPI002542E06C|nr:VOC family protein [Rubrivivax pictus]